MIDSASDRPLKRLGNASSFRPFDMHERLQELEDDICVVIAGAGAMGRGLLHQCNITPAFRCVALADHRQDVAVDCATSMGIPYEVVHSLGSMQDCIRRGNMAVCADPNVLAQLEGADVFIDATSAIAAAGRFCTTALDHGMHLVMMNAEADLAFGPYLMNRANQNGVTYASCDGDQHTVIKRLIDDLRLWGFELVMAGNIKGYLDRYANPTSIIPEADKRNLDYHMCTAYTDGTKLGVEMALLANALGLKTAVPGMYGPSVDHVQEVKSCFDLETIWQEHGPIVEYILGAEPDGGIFAVGYCDDPYQQQMMEYYKMGEGPFYIFYRPYHLCHVEALEAIARACLDGQSLMEPRYGHRADVFAYAKKDLQAGDVLDGIGGYACYGLIENENDQGKSPGIPVTLADDIILKREVTKDDKILLTDIEYQPDRLDFDLYRQSKKLAGELVSNG